MLDVLLDVLLDSFVSTSVWGLNQLGIQALIGTSFAGIFFDNCARNGLLAVVVGEDGIAALMERAYDPTRANFEVDLLNQRIDTSDGFTFRFEIEPTRKEALLEGLDAVRATLRHQDEIIAFERSHLERNPWRAASPKRSGNETGRAKGAWLGGALTKTAAIRSSR